MQEVKIGDHLNIQCYKHNEKVRCHWNEAVVLDVKPDYIVCGNNKTLVVEDTGVMWRTKEPAIVYFFKKQWFNVISQMKNDGIYYYCNIATPYIIEDNTIKYIDYDLDLRIFPDGRYKILDQREYEYHKQLMGYDEKLDQVVTEALDDLIEKYKKNYFVFNTEKNNEYCEKYFNVKKQPNF